MGDRIDMDRILGRTGLTIAPIAFGAFKIGRNQGIKYERGYALPDDDATSNLLNGVVDAGITLVDTAPAYGLSEERIGRHLGDRRDEIVLSTKVGESFERDASTYGFDADSVHASIARSLERLQTDCLDLVHVHSDGSDQAILDDGSTVSALKEAQDRGEIRFLGFSGKTTKGNLQAVRSGDFDVIMVEYHPLDASQAPVIDAAAENGVGVLIKKGLASGRLSPSEAIPFCLDHPGVTSVVVGSLELAHLEDDLAIAYAALSGD